jgi:hypothetical protein
MSLARCTIIHRILIVVLAAAVATQAQTSAPDARSSGESVVQPVQSPADLPKPVSPMTERTAMARYGSLLGMLNQAGALTEAVLVIPGNQIEPQAMEQVVEDLSVMSRIIEKNLSEDPVVGKTPILSDMPMRGTFLKSGKGRWMFGGAEPGNLFSTNGRPKPMYVGGYGAVFFLQVGFPLLAPPEGPQAQEAPAKEDPVWAEAKRSLLEPQSAGPQLGQPIAAPQPYSAERVEALKSELLSSMKYATNIRGLAPTDHLVLVVQGPAPATSDASPDADSYGKTVLTLRATRADIELFATDKIDRKQFEQRVQTITY